MDGPSTYADDSSWGDASFLDIGLPPSLDKFREIQKDIGFHARFLDVAGRLKKIIRSDEDIKHVLAFYYDTIDSSNQDKVFKLLQSRGVICDLLVHKKKYTQLKDELCVQLMEDKFWKLLGDGCSMDNADTCRCCIRSAWNSTVRGLDKRDALLSHDALRPYRLWQGIVDMSYNNLGINDQQFLDLIKEIASLQCFSLEQLIQLVSSAALILNTNHSLVGVLHRIINRLKQLEEAKNRGYDLLEAAMGRLDQNTDSGSLAVNLEKYIWTTASPSKEFSKMSLFEVADPTILVKSILRLSKGKMSFSDVPKKERGAVSFFVDQKYHILRIFSGSLEGSELKQLASDLNPFFRELASSYDMGVGPSLFLSRLKCLVDGLSLIESFPNEMRMMLLRQCSDIISEYSTSCADRAIIGLEALEDFVSIIENKGNLEALISIGIGIIKRRALWNNAGEAESIEVYLRWMYELRTSMPMGSKVLGMRHYDMGKREGLSSALEQMLSITPDDLIDQLLSLNPLLRHYLLEYYDVHEPLFSSIDKAKLYNQIDDILPGGMQGVFYERILKAVEVLTGSLSVNEVEPVKLKLRDALQELGYLTPAKNLSFSGSYELAEKYGRFMSLECFRGPYDEV